VFFEHPHHSPPVDRERFEAVHIAMELATVIGMLGAVVFDEHLEASVEKVASTDESAIRPEDVAVEFGLGKAAPHQQQSQLGLLR
jgi:hypothetical protein